MLLRFQIGKTGFANLVLYSGVVVSPLGYQYILEHTVITKST